jgi:aconitate decarboxylase
MQHAIGLAATQVIGLREMFGSHTKSFHPGRAGQSGLMAAVLASNGYTSSLQALEAKKGWASVVSVSNNLDVQIDSLGKVWEITKNAYKPFPCGIVVHPVIDGCIQLHQELKAAGIGVSPLESRRFPTLGLT